MAKPCGVGVDCCGWAFAVQPRRDKPVRSAAGGGAGDYDAPNPRRQAPPRVQQSSSPNPFDEVLGNIRRQTAGQGTVEDLNLPEEFLRHAVFRVIRASYQDHFRIVVGQAPAPVIEAAPAGAEAGLVRCVPSVEVSDQRQVSDGPAALRGYRDNAWPWPLALSPRDPAMAAAGQVVATRLARDGLVNTLVAAIRVLGPDRVKDDDAGNGLLQEVGFPVDLFRCFGGVTVARAAQAARSADAPALRLPFAFSPTRPGFRVNAEIGSHPISSVRVHATRAEYWGGRGAGSSLDVIRQLCDVIPEASMLVSTDGAIASEVAAACSGFRNPARITVAASPGPVSQWAQDNGKPGRNGDGSGALLVPRFASRSEEFTTFVPGDTQALSALSRAGVDVVRSPLHFQGGNLMVIEEPRSQERVLLIGEAEVYRNVALGLTADQTLEALGVEFGVDRCVVLPAVSFHIDFEVSVRRVEDQLVALVNDTPAAARLILQVGIGALVRSSLTSAGEKAGLSDLLPRLIPAQVLAMVGPIITRFATGYGQFTLALADQFSTGPTDSGVGNFQRFLLALDLLAAELLSVQRPADPYLATFLDSLVYRDQARRRLWRQLESLGLRLVRVPSLSDAERSISAINGLHEPGRYLMPAYGGLYAPVDAAASEALQKALPGVQVVPIFCAETQRRAGGLHCAASVS